MLTAGANRVPRVIPRMNRFAAGMLSARTFSDVPHRVFTAQRAVVFREMEYAVPREAGLAVLAEARKAIDASDLRISFPVEIRTAPADDIPLSTAYQRDSLYLAFHTHRDAEHRDYFALLEPIMRAHDGRPHWGKVHTRTADDLRPAYARFDDFLAMRDRLDPDRVFANPHLRADPGRLTSAEIPAWRAVAVPLPQACAVVGSSTPLRKEPHEMSAQELPATVAPGLSPESTERPAPSDARPQRPADTHLRLRGLTDDGTRLLLVDGAGLEFTVDVDARLRAALHGDPSRSDTSQQPASTPTRSGPNHSGQGEDDGEHLLRPRDIQARIRAGETPEAVAEAAQTTVEKVMPYAAPVLAEREHVAQRALRASIRRPAASESRLAGTSRTLGEAISCPAPGDERRPGLGGLGRLAPRGRPVVADRELRGRRTRGPGPADLRPARQLRAARQRRGALAGRRPHRGRRRPEPGRPSRSRPAGS